MFELKKISLAILTLAISGQLTAKPVASLKEAAESAVMTSPEILAKWHDYLATAEEQGVAKGGFLPKVNLTLGVGREKQVDPGQEDRTYNRSGGAISLRQMIFDGFATSNQVKQFGHAKLAKYYELLATTDDIVLQVAKAYWDVQRYRELVSLAKDNYAIHRGIFDQIEDRVKAGVGRRVDLEQASGRLALAESNWLTEESNLHDVTVVFQRLVGEVPADSLADAPTLASRLPRQADVLNSAFSHNPSFLSAVENIRSARAQLQVAKANNLPSLEFRANHDITRNQDGVIGKHKTNVVELVLNYNLFNGGSDAARGRQYSEQLNLALDLRDKACRDIRQVASIAWNDVQKLKEQIGYLEQHQLSTEKARDAYRKQFDIGQRTLLDLLDTENELFDAKRSLVNAQYDYKLAEARVLASGSKLMPALALTPITRDAPEGVDNSDSNDADRYTCGDLRMIPAVQLNKDSVVIPKYVSNIALPENAEKPVSVNQQEQVNKFLNAWTAAWSAEDVNGYLASYADTFTPEAGLSRAQWEKQRKQRLTKSGDIAVKLEDIKIDMVDSTHANAQFMQKYESKSFKDVTQKKLELMQKDGKWFINKESLIQ
ncbi:TolC family outer membrane protein [Leeia sp. TBRC 13508]|uniref:TolC family outer membrane protein n=1 Tax=Leeia speluncae TaxID=2884804 RepID=A0ABS8D8F3_9NEIS|nr:TolC family outer membrane protein [Leeia speluncae]MCB6184461.1 TolC family outer membrane protein [Leeia speluncae]